MMRLSSVMRLSFASLTMTAAEMSWEEFKNLYGKVYNAIDDDALRKEVYDANVQKIVDHNAKNESWTMAVNEFADLTQDEFKAKFISKRSMKSDPDGEPEVAEVFDVPRSMDWVKKGKVNPVRTQHNEDCWAFSATGTLESSYAIATGHLQKLSEQQLCDCSSGGTCRDGGDEVDALASFKYGACSRKSYPYTGKDGKCKFSSCQKLVPKGAVTRVQLVGKDAKSWKQALAKTPFTMAASADVLPQFYSSGVISDSESGGVVTKSCYGKVDHALIAVGYGTDSRGKDYFKIRNSWGPSWGEHGYVRLAQESSSSRGTACIFESKGSYPIIHAAVHEGENSYVTV